MLHIILLILKIIGIILLGILGILLLAVCCALFVPLRYRIEVFREEGEGKPPVSVRIKITWLLHLINVLLRYPSEVYVRARIFLFTVFRMPEKEKKGKKKRGGRKKDTDGNRAGTEREEYVKETNGPRNGGKDEDGGSTAGGIQAIEKTEEKRQTETAGQESAEAEETAESEGADPTQEPSGLIGRWIGKIRRFFDKIKELIRKIKAAVENIQYTIRNFCDKIKSTLDNIQYYREVIESEPFRRSFSLCRKQLGALLKEIKPDRFEADLIIGTEDPATTGEILAICGMLYPFMGGNVRVVGDFERAHIEGYIYMQGTIHAFPFLCAAVRVYRNKDIRTLIKLFKKEAV